MCKRFIMVPEILSVKTYDLRDLESLESPSVGQ